MLTPADVSPKATKLNDIDCLILRKNASLSNQPSSSEFLDEEIKQMIKMPIRQGVQKKDVLYDHSFDGESFNGGKESKNQDASKGDHEIFRMLKEHHNNKRKPAQIEDDKNKDHEFYYKRAKDSSIIHNSDAF